MSDPFADMLLEAEQERENTLEALRSLIEEERRERAFITTRLDTLQQKLDSLVGSGANASHNVSGKKIDLTVTGRDAQERIERITIKLSQ